MKNALFALLLILPQIGCAGARRAPTPEPVPTVTASPSPAPTVSPSPVPTDAPRLTVNKISGASKAEEKMIRDALVIANKALLSPCYKQWVEAAKYTENQDLSQKEIYKKISTEPVTVNVEMYTGTWYANHVSKTVGYENVPYDGVVHMNRYFVNTASKAADNLLHEAEGHSQGFTHYQVKSTSEPYGMNYAYEGCSQPQLMQAKGGKPYRPPGIRLEIRKKKDKKRSAMLSAPSLKVA